MKRGRSSNAVSEKRMKKPENYNFVPVKEALGHLEKQVNLLGCVVEFGFPRKSKGTDYVYTIKIVDDSYPGAGLTVNIFASNVDGLPHFKSVGDLIQLSHVTMKSFGNEVYATVNKAFSSFALFDGKSNEDFNPYQVSDKFRAKDCAKESITRIRTWFPTFQFDEGASEFLLSLKEIKEDHGFDLICKVLLVTEFLEHVWLFVWDGTDTPPLNFNMKLSDEAETPYPLQLEPTSLPRNSLCTFPTVGSILRVVVDKSCEKYGLHLISSGEWVKLRNITAKVKSSFWCGNMMPNSKFRCLPKKDSVVVQRIRSYEERVSSKWGRLPLWSSPCPSPSPITEIDVERSPCVTLMDFLTYPEVTAKAMCVVRFVSVYPWRAEDFRAPAGTHEYRMRFTIEDPTSRIHAYLFSEDGVKFFDGYPDVDVLRRKRNQLLGVSDEVHGEEAVNASSRNPPWVKICLKSYYCNKNDAWGSRNFRIFGTRVVDQGI